MKIGLTMAALSLTMLLPASASNEEISVYLDAAKIEFDVEPQVVDGRTMVPVRAIAEKMGVLVEWDGATNTAIFTKADAVVKMTIGSEDLYVNDQLIRMDVSPIAVNGRTLIPVRYIAEAFDADVQWSQQNSAVVICSKDVYAYANYPDIPDLGRCYNIPSLGETTQNGYQVISYVYSDRTNDDYYSYLYDHSAAVLGGYAEETVGSVGDVLTIAYTPAGGAVPRYFIDVHYDENGNMVFEVRIPEVGAAENKVTLYALDGRTVEVLYGEVPAYLAAGWYGTLEETTQTLYAPDGRTTTVFKAEVPSYRAVGWYESQSEAENSRKTTTGSSSSNSYNPGPDGYYYRTPTGKRYHLDPNCGGKNSYRTTNISGLTPCQKCAR